MMRNKFFYLTLVAFAMVSGCGKRSDDHSSSSASAKADCMAEVSAQEDAVVARCSTQECIQREVKALMNKCASK
jgi:hypothetical protein